MPDPSIGKIELVLQGNNYGAQFLLTKNTGVPDQATDVTATADEKLYLTDQTTAQKQLTVINTAPVPCGAGTGSSFDISLCRSDSAGAVELDTLQAGQMYDALFSVSAINCAQTPCAPDGSGTLQVVLVKNNGTIVVLDQVPVDLRPLQNWMTVYSFRSGGITPLNHVTLPLNGWTSIPGNATTLNVLVHGCCTDQADVTESVLPSYFKRLYWSGQQMIMAQNNAHTVGISWYGDVSTLNWSDDEFSALENGVPMANFLSDQADAGMKIRIFAHSLGNLVVNSALTRGQYEANHALSKHAVTSFVMNDAAIPAEAFDQQYNAQDLSALLVAHATVADGYLPADAVWAAQWLDMQTLNPAALAQWSLTTQSTNYVTQPPPLYQTRWSQMRPAGGVPDAALPNSTPQRGSWLGYFASNIGQIGSITNTFNGGDGILSSLTPGVWLWAQDYTKPNTLGNVNLGVVSAFVPDNEISQYWATLTHLDGSQELLWGSPCSSASTCKHSNILRQWGELAYWFPSVSNATGQQSLSTIPSLDFGSYAPFSLIPSSTHSYMRLQPYYAVYPAWQKVHGAMK